MHKYNTSSNTIASKEITDNAQICTCCPVHKNSGTCYKACLQSMHVYSFKWL